MKIVLSALVVAVALCSAEIAIGECVDTARLRLSVVDISGAAIAASVRVDGTEVERTDEQGKLLVPCLVAGAHTIEVTAPGFQHQEVHETKAADRAGALVVTLSIASVSAAVNVTSDEETATSPGAKADTLTAEQLRGLSADPDEFRRQLLALAASNGSQSNVVISVDRFQ